MEFELTGSNSDLTGGASNVKLDLVWSGRNLRASPSLQVIQDYDGDSHNDAVGNLKGQTRLLVFVVHEARWDPLTRLQGRDALPERVWHAGFWRLKCINFDHG